MSFSRPLHTILFLFAYLFRLKFFAHPDLTMFKREELDPWFHKVVVDKPKESRSGVLHSPP